MFARVSIIQGKPEKVEDGIRHLREETIPAVKQQEGFKSIYFLVNRQSGKFMAISLWETEQALQASNAAADRVRARAAQTIDATAPPQVEMYEVAAAVMEPAKAATR